MQVNPQTGMLEPRENVVAGIVGAFLFSLVGGILTFVLYQVGFVAAISGAVGVVCAIKGYAIFAKKESLKGVIIASLIAVLVIVLAWYLSLSFELFKVCQEWYETGEIEYAVTFAESVQGLIYYFEDPEFAKSAFGDLALQILFCALGCFSPIRNAIAALRQKNNPEAEVAAQNAAVAEDAPADPVE